MKNKTKIIAIAAITIDGKIARKTNQRSDWTSIDDKISLRKLIAGTEVVIVGHTTYKLYKSELAKRMCIVFTRSVKDYEQNSTNLFLYNPAGDMPIRELVGAHRSIAVLGGAQIYSYFLEQDLIDDLYLTVEPIIFGAGVNLLTGENSIDARFKLVSCEKLNHEGTLILHYKR